MSIMRRIGKAVGNVASGYSKEKDAEERRDAQRVILAVMAEKPDASEKDIARVARARLAKEHGKDYPRLDWVTADAVTRLQRALALAALERKKETNEE